MAKPNNAIYSWSGFNYQGKVMLFYILNLINKKLDIDESYNDYFVEIEKREDFVIYKNREPVSFHQVKATLSRKKVSGYLKALGKLVDHRNDSGFSTAQCYLMSAADIDDWNASGNAFRSSVSLYKYNGDIVGIEEVPNLIKEQIDEYSKKHGILPHDTEIIYLELCRFLDDKISFIHSGKSSNYTIYLSEITNEILNASQKSNENNNARFKENVYLHIVKKIKASLIAFCHMNCKTTPDICNEDCGAKKHFDDILNIDIMKHAKIINPDKIGDWDLLDYVSFFPESNYKDSFFALLSNMSAKEVIIEDQATNLEDFYYNSERKRIFPTLLHLHPLPGRETTCLSTTMRQIDSNSIAHEYLNGSVITAITGGKIFDTYSDKVTAVPIESRKYTNNHLNVRIIDRDQLILDHDKHFKGV